LIQFGHEVSGEDFQIFWAKSTQLEYKWENLSHMSNY